MKRIILSVLAITLIITGCANNNIGKQAKLEKEKITTEKLIESGNKLTQEKKYKEAIDAFSMVINKDSENTYAYNQLGSLYLVQNKNDKALINYNKALELDSKNEKTFFNLGQYYYIIKDYKKSVDYLEQCIDISMAKVTPETSSETINIHNSIFELLTNITKEDSKNAKAYFVLGVLYNTYESYESAKINFIKAVDLGLYDRSYYFLGRITFNLGQYEESYQYFIKSLDYEKTHYDIYYRLANILFLTSNIDEAIKNYRKSIELKPDYLGSYFLLGELYFINNQYQEALAVYSEALNFFPDNGDIYYNLALINYYSDNYDASLKNNEKAIELGFDKGSAEYFIGLIYYDLDNLELANKYLNIAFSKDANLYFRSINYDSNIYRKSAYHYNMALQLNKLNKFNKTIFHLKKHLNKNPYDSEAAYLLGQTYLKIGRTNTAKEVFKNIIKFNPNYKISYLALGHIYESEKDYTKAKEIYQALLKINSLDSDGLYYLGNIFIFENRFSEAINLYEDIASRNPAYKDIYSGLAFSYFQIENYEKSLENYKINSEYYPDKYDSWFRLAITAYIQNDLELSAKSYEKSIELKPDNLNNILSLGMTYYKLKNYDKTIETLSQLLETDFDSYLVYFYLGMSYEKTDLNKAKEILIKGMDLYPDKVPLIEEFAIVNNLLGNYDTALESFLKAIELDPEDDIAKLNLKEFYITQERYVDVLNMELKSEKTSLLNTLYIFIAKEMLELDNNIEYKKLASTENNLNLFFDFSWFELETWINRVESKADSNKLDKIKTVINELKYQLKKSSFE